MCRILVSTNGSKNDQINIKGLEWYEVEMTVTTVTTLLALRILLTT